MALTASVALTPSSQTAGQKVAVAVTVSNDGPSAVRVTSVQGQCDNRAYDGLNFYIPFGSSSALVPASGSAVFNATLVPLKPQGGENVLGTPTQDYVVGATVCAQDGSVVEASTATLTASAPDPGV